jgi:CRP-like cAMP-binding protein
VKATTPGRSFVLLSGYAFSYKTTGESKRQMLAFHIPGDAPDLQSLHLKTMDNSVGTLTPCEIGFMEHAHIRALCHRNPRVADALWRESLIASSVFRDGC